jgi:hypothetical protein
VVTVVDRRALTQLAKADLEAAARVLGLSPTGTKAALLQRITAEAERLDVNTTGPGQAAILAIAQRQGGSS